MRYFGVLVFVLHLTVSATCQITSDEVIAMYNNARAMKNLSTQRPLYKELEIYTGNVCGAVGMTTMATTMPIVGIALAKNFSELGMSGVRCTLNPLEFAGVSTIGAIILGAPLGLLLGGFTALMAHPWARYYAQRSIQRTIAQAYQRKLEEGCVLDPHVSGELKELLRDDELGMQIIKKALKLD